MPRSKKDDSKIAQVDVPDQVMSEPDDRPDDEGDDVPNGDFEFDSDMAESEPGSGADMPSDMSEGEDEGGVVVPTGRAISPSELPLLNPIDDDPTVLSTSAAATDADAASLHPQRPTPYAHDAGLLMVTDPNPLPRSTAMTLEATLAANARDAAQSLLNHLLTTCPIHSAPVTSTSTSGVIMTLPPPRLPLPREKKVPVPKPPTKWEQFAARKGIGANNRKGGVGRDGQLKSTEGKMVYDEDKGEWVPKWGYKGRNRAGEGEWIVEVDGKKEASTGEPADARAEDRAARKDRVKRNERLQRANERRARKGKAAS